ncbi:hypothetical protein [Bradyrhizobium sp. NP1]|uniref:hypothetical protein n=1 Tax=Bradyrhizobium sp. NP1 TaxID=3049772 RepID=UPI0025A559C2|nr:hypothetical protein [Bradyrhizobium sp. NP1]WJR81498.1 hypothetical protein QOU61_17655 [Bradyrhizobium sp. NP1]
MLAVAARSSLVCWLGAVSFCSSQQIVAAQLNLLSADLAFHFVCEGKSRGEPEKAIEPFLRASGFRVLNLAEIQRRHDVNLFDTNVIALDRDGRIIDIRSVPQAHRRYSFYLYSSPPTSHSNDLEEQILTFVSGDLGCEVRQIERHENRELQKGFYESELRRVERLFEEADRINGKRRL